MLTRNFQLSEFTRSATADQLGICNQAPQFAINNLQRLCQDILQPIRDRYGKPIIITSGYRCRALNKAVGGARNSDHLYGCAADIKPLPDSTSMGNREEVKRLFDLIKQMIAEGTIEVKQLIDEHNYSWIHISHQDGRTTTRNQILHLL